MPLEATFSKREYFKPNLHIIKNQIQPGNLRESWHFLPANIKLEVNSQNNVATINVDLNEAVLKGWVYLNIEDLHKDKLRKRGQNIDFAKPVGLFAGMAMYIQEHQSKNTVPRRDLIVHFDVVDLEVEALRAFR